MPSRGEPQAVYLFDQLQDVLEEVRQRHAALGQSHPTTSATTTLPDGLTACVRESYDPSRPPAASKVMVHGVGMAQRTMTVDMIAVPAKP